MAEDLVLFRRFGSREQAEAVRQKLQSFDIAAHFSTDDAGGWMHSFGAPAGRIELLVHPDDVEKAASLLDGDEGDDGESVSLETDEERSRFFDGDMPLASPLQGKSKVLAVYIVLVCGPLGLVYVRAWSAALVCWLVGMFLLILDLGALWYAIAARVLGATYACHLISEDSLRGTPEFESRRMLEEAADMEDKDRFKAIEIYESIVDRYPNSRARKEAERNIEVLCRSV